MSTPHQPNGPRPATSTTYRPVTSTPCRLATSTPYQLATSTPYQPVGDHRGGDMFVPRQTPTLPACLEIPDTSAPLCRAPQETRQGYRTAAPIQCFNNKSLNWPAWFRHFRAVADVHGWDKNQRALQLVSYLDETAMKVAQELADDELYDYDTLVKLLSDRFDPASRGFCVPIAIPWPDETPPRGRRCIRRCYLQTVLSGIPAKPTGVTPGTHQRTIRLGPIRP